MSAALFLRLMESTRVASFVNSWRNRKPPIPDNCEDWPFLQYLSLPNYDVDRTGYPRVAAKHPDPGQPKEE